MAVRDHVSVGCGLGALALLLTYATAQLADPQTAVPPVDMITPVPAPEIRIGDDLPTDDDFEMPETLNIRNLGGTIEGNPSEGWIRFGGPVVITTDTGVEIFANRARVDTRAGTATLEGDVSIYQGNTLQRGARAVYDYKRRVLDTTGMRASVDPFILESGRFTAETIDGKLVFIGHDAGITTHDMDQPNYWVRAAETRVYPGDKVVFRDLTLEAGGVPVFWLPYFSQPLNSELGYHFVPGARTSWGPYLLNTYGAMLGGERDPATGENRDAWLLSRWRVDLRGRRGLGTGVDFLDTREENPNLTGLSLYYAYDLDPDITASGRPSLGEADENRYRIDLQHRHTFQHTGDAHWWADANLSWLSDSRFLEDFEPQRFRLDPAPDNTLGVFRRDNHSLFSLFTRLRVNEFLRTDTRLPEIAFDQSRRPLFGLPLLHEGTTSFSVLNEKAGDATRRTVLGPLFALAPGDPAAPAMLNQLSGYERIVAGTISTLPLGDPRREALQSQLLDNGFSRFHSYQEIQAPFKVAGAVNLVPQAGIGYTRYDGIDSPIADFDRFHAHLSTEASVKFTRRYEGIVKPGWGIDGLSHVVQPYTHWSWFTTDSVDPAFLGIDRLTPGTRPLPLDPLRFTATDSLAKWSTLRFGARNRLLTRRDGQSHQWLYHDSYFDVFIEDPEGMRDVSNLYNTLRVDPLPWLGVDVYTQFPIATGGSGFSEYETRLRLMPTPDLEVSLGYRLLDGHPVLPDSNRVDLSLYKRINENWGVGTLHGVELADGTLEVQQYSIHRDLGNWLIGAAFTHRDNRVDNDYGIVFSITLKDFPSISLPFKIDAE